MAAISCGTSIPRAGAADAIDAKVKKIGVGDRGHGIDVINPGGVTFPVRTSGIPSRWQQAGAIGGQIS